MAKKAFNELTEQGKKNRLAKYAAQDAQYGLSEGLVRITRGTRHADREFTNEDGSKHTAASFGFNMVPAKGIPAEDMEAGKFIWANQLINTDTGAKVIEAMDELVADLKKPEVKSVLASIKYKKDGAYINLNSVYRRTATKKAAPATDDLPL